MEKIISKNIELTSNIRGIDKLQHELYSKDKEIAEFHFTTKELPAEKVICLFHFKGTKRYKEVEAVIDGNNFTVKFDNSLIIASETVVGYIYFEKVEKSADVYTFSFHVKVSEIDKAAQAPVMEQKTKRVIDVNNIVTKDELESLLPKSNAPTTSYDDSELRAELASKANQSDVVSILDDIKALKSKPDNDTIYDDKPLVERVVALENKPSVDTSDLVTKSELDGKGYLTQHQSLDDYVKHSELPDPYNDTELKKRVETLENKKEVDTSKFVTEEALAGKGYLTQHQNLDEYAKKSEIPQPYNDSGVKQRLTLIEQKEPQRLNLNGNTLSLSGGGGSVVLPSTPANAGGQVNEYEIHGQGMPNGKVVAPVGTTYVDTVATNGALKWIKRTGNHNQGWEVLTGDTGWRTLPIVSKLGNSFLKVRRKNDTVMYQFGGLSWGWFGIVRRGGAGYSPQGSDRERNCYILGLGGVPVGFRSESSLIGGIYNDKGTPYGTWYLGGNGDSHMLRFQFTDPVPTDRDIGDIRVSSISYLTSDLWPTTLP
nr:MAG TPA: hypothetical protein [Caudoviricetes sp.]